MSNNERQKHGFLYEDQVIQRFSLVKEEEYTALWDARTQTGVPVSIKTKKLNSDIEMADMFRNALERNQDFYLIVGFWNGEKTNIVEEYILYIPAHDWKELFNVELLPAFSKFLKLISNKSSDDLKWTIGCDLLKEKWKNTTKNLIRPRFKRDHKKQKRIQCAINNQDFYRYFLNKYEVNDFGS